MVLGYHLILSAYGFWLPNDPRGSWSTFVGSWELYRFGAATTTTCRRSLAQRPHDRERRLAAKRALKYPAVRFNGRQAQAVGAGFGNRVRESQLTAWACTILPEHAHLVIARHTYPAEQVANLLKGSATTDLLRRDLHPLAGYAAAGWRPPTPWARGQWKVFLKTEAEVDRASRYVEANPAREGLPPQKWSFVVPYPGTCPSGEVERFPSGRG
ncbi:MAG: hypothetical protein AMJ81_03190 [Phycisphaerae bacterium SM23_33]|nr:MAG: hypothetical protein AMJ81_03190 [Phycisphaerae bacterium SM23_33]